MKNPFCEIQFSQRVFAPFMEVKLQLLAKPAIANLINNFAHLRTCDPWEAKHVHPHLGWQITERFIEKY